MRRATDTCTLILTKAEELVGDEPAEFGMSEKQNMGYIFTHTPEEREEGFKKN